MILKSNRRPTILLKGAHVVSGRCGGHHPTEAILAAVDAFRTEFEREPEQERCVLTIFFTTFETVCELAEQPEEWCANE